MSKIEEALRRARGERADDHSPEPAPMHEREVEPRPRREASRGGQLVGISAAEQIARMREESVRDRDELAARRIITKDMDDAQVADAFRHLRTNLFQRTESRNIVVMVSAVTADGGASFVSLNLAAAIAFDESATALLVNCNLHDPTLDELVQARQAPAPGLTDLLTGEEQQVERIIHPIGIPRVRLIPAGSKSPSAMEYFTMPRLRHLLHELRKRYRERTVILDAPPITEAADARILSQLCDYVLLVVPYGRVTNVQVAAAAQAVGKDKLIGCVLNNERRMPMLSPRPRVAGWA